MDKNKVLDFFDYLKNDKESAEKFKTITEKLSTVKNEESAKKLLEEELIPFAKSKGYNITYEDFLNFTKTQETELSDDILEMASGGRSEFWNRIGQSLLIFGTGAGLFAGATFNAMGGFGGGKSKSSDNRPAAVQTVDQNRTKSSINNIRKELQDRNKESEIDKELGTKAKDDTYVSSNKSKSNRSFRNTVARANKGANTKARGAYLNKADNLEMKSRFDASKVSEENKKVVEKVKEIVKSKDEVKKGEDKVEEIKKEEKVEEKVEAVKKAELPKLRIDGKGGEELKKEANDYLKGLDGKIIKNNANILKKFFTLGFGKNFIAQEDVNLIDVLNVIKDLNKLTNKIKSDSKNVDFSAENKKINEYKSNCQEAIKAGLKEINQKHSATKWEDVANKDKYEEALKDIENFVGKTNDIEANYEGFEDSAKGLKETIKTIEKFQTNLEKYENYFKEINKIFDEIKSDSDPEKVKKDLLDVLNNLDKNDHVAAKNDSFRVADLLAKILNKFEKIIEDKISQNSKNTDKTKELEDASEYAKKVGMFINEINGNNYSKKIKINLNNGNINEKSEKIKEVTEKIQNLDNLLKEEKFKKDNIENEKDTEKLNNLIKEIDEVKKNFESGNLFKEADEKIKEIKKIDEENRYLEDLKGKAKSGDIEKTKNALKELIDKGKFDYAYCIIEDAFDLTSDGKLALGYKYTSDNFLDLINSQDLLNYLKGESKKAEYQRSDAFKKFEDLFNKENKGIKSYFKNKNNNNVIKELNGIFNPNEQRQNDLKKLVTEGKYSEENLNKIIEKLKDCAKNNDIESVYTIVSEAYKTTSDKYGSRAKFSSEQFAQILNGAKDELVELLSDENVKKSNFYNNFKELFNKEGGMASSGGVKAYLGEDKVVELDDVLNYSGTDENIIKAKLERDKRLAKSGNFEAIKNRLNNAINKKEYQNVMEIVKAATDNIGSISGYGRANVAKIIEDSKLKNYLENSNYKDQELYKNFRKYFNETLKEKLGNVKLAEDLDAKLNPNLSEDIKKLSDTKDLRAKGKINDISKLLGDRIKEAKDDARKLDNVLKIIDTVYNDTGGSVAASKTFGVGEFTDLIKDNCGGLVELLNDNKDTDFYKNLKTTLKKAIDGGWINDQGTKDKLKEVLSN